MIKLKDLLSETHSSSDSFKHWFRGSKIVDKSNMPMKLYHGTDRHISKFDSVRMGKSSNVFGTWEIQRYGIFLAEDENLAKEFGKHIIEVYGRCYSPLDLRVSLSDGKFNTMSEIVDNKGGNGFQFSRFIERHTGGNAWKLFDNDDGYDPKFMLDIFKEMDYDGCIINEPTENDVNTKVWILFDSEQVWIDSQH